MTTWTPILITTDGDVLLYKAVGDYFCLLKHSVSGTQRHSYPREEAQALYAALGQWLGADEMICEAEHCHARPVRDCDAVPTAGNGHLMPLAASMAGDWIAHDSPDPGHATGNPDAKHGVSAESVLEHCLAVEQGLWGNSSSFLSEQSLKEQLMAWRLPATGRYADHASELARQSGGQYPVEVSDADR